MAGADTVEVRIEANTGDTAAKIRAVRQEIAQLKAPSTVGQLTKELEELKTGGSNALQGLQGEMKHVIALFQAGVNLPQIAKHVSGGGPAASLTLPEMSVTAARLPSAGLWPTRAGRGGGSAKGMETQIEQWQEELDKRLMAERNFFKDSTAEELAFWQSKLAATQAGSKEQYEVERRIYELEKELAHQREADAEATLDAQKRVSDACYQREVQAAQEEVRLGRMSASEGLAAEIQLLDQKWAADQEYFAKKKAAAQNDTKTQEQIDNEELVAHQTYLTQLSKLEADAALQMQTRWRDALKPIEDAFDQFVDAALSGTKRIGAAFQQLAQSLLKDAVGSLTKSFFGSMLGTGNGSGGGGILGGVGSMAAGGLLKLLGLSSGGLLGSLIGGAGAGGGFLLPGTATALAGAWSGGSAADAIAGGSVLSRLSSLLPAAAGGWVVPQFAQGGVLSIVHGGEMVLPEHISNGLQSAISGGTFGSGHTINISAVDASSVARLFRNNGSALVSALNSAMRNGSLLNQAT
jgi:hypothetical protein